MRTSPLGMRRRPRRAPLLALSTLVLVVSFGAACSDDGGDDGTSPTTTSPATTEAADEPSDDDGTTTTEPAEDQTTTSEAGGTTEPGAVPGDDADVLTAEQAGAQLDALLEVYDAALAESQATATLDESTLVAFTGAFTTSAAQGELDGLRSVGAPATLAPEAPPLGASEVELLEATGTCARGTLRFDGFEGVTTTPAPEVTTPFYFRLVPARDGDPAPAWRIDFLRFGSSAEEASACES